MKRILHISKYYFPYIGGTEQVARDFVNALQDTEYEQKVICFNEDVPNAPKPCHRNETVHDMVDGVEVIRCSCVTKVVSQSISLSYPRKLKLLMDDFQPDIVVLHFPNPYVSHLLLRYKRREFKLLVYWHLDITKQKVLRKLFHGQTLRLIEHADYIIGATPKHVDESAYSKYFKDKKYILPYAMNQERLQISAEEIAQANDIRARYPGKVLGLFAGRHVPYKGLRYLIEASKYLDDRIQFLIVGQGELTEKLKLMASGDQKIEFLGSISDSLWRSYLYACDIFCFPSITRNEGFGLALVEAMNFKKPAVTFTIPGSGVNYVNLHEVTGIECPNRDSKAYAAAIQKLADNPGLRKTYGQNGRQRVLDHFSEERFKKNVGKLIDGL